jgi:hypothetical protein
MTGAGLDFDPSDVLCLGGTAGTLSPAHTHRFIRTLNETVDRLDLDLGGLSVATEAATGYFAALPVIAAAAGARVWAVPADNRFGTTKRGISAVVDLASLVGIDAGRVEFCSRENLPFEAIDIMTNSRSLRPIDETVIDRLPGDAVITLMYEAWELRPGDVDLKACLDRGIRVVGVDEHHPLVDSFRYCGLLVVKMLFSAGVDILGSTIVILGSDEFAEVAARTLDNLGANLVRAVDLSFVDSTSAVDAVVHTDLVPGPNVGRREGWERISLKFPGAVVVQLNGGLPDDVIHDVGLELFPLDRVPAHTMGWSLAELGHNPVLRLFGGSLKAAEEIHKPSRRLGVGQPITLSW